MDTKILTQLADQTLSILVMDMGYDKPPVYGKDPIRHQYAWELVLAIYGQEVLNQKISEMEKQKAREHHALTQDKGN